MATFNEWVQGARPRTLPVAVSPVAVGTGAAYALGQTTWGYALLALVVALSPAGRGQLRERLLRRHPRDRRAPRVGPVRLVGQDLANPTDVRLAAFVGVLPRGARAGSRSSR